MAHKTIIRLTESDIHRIIKEAVSKAINEDWDDFKTSKKGLPSIEDNSQWDYNDEEGEGYEDDGSSATSINNRLAYPTSPLEKKNTFHNGDTWLDLGGGQFDNLSHHLQKEYGVTTLIFDPFAQSGGVSKIVDEEGNVIDSEPALRGEMLMKDIKETIEFLGGVDNVMCNNVLNVIPSRSAIENTILQAAEALKPQGVAYFKIYTGDETGEGRFKNNTNKATKQKSRVFQQNKKPELYLPLIQKYFNEVKIASNYILARSPKDVSKQAIWAYDKDFENNLEDKRLNKFVK